jgi:predicted MFS family arabinose efflux permease
MIAFALCPADQTVFLSLLFPYALSNFYRVFLAVVSNDLSRDLGIDAAGLANLQVAFLLAFALTQFPVGFTLDRFGPRRILMLGLCGAVAGSLLLASASEAWQAILAMALLGAGFSPALMTAFYLIGRNYPPSRFATVSSLLFGLGMMGDPLSGTPLTMAVNAFGWRPTMLAMGGITAASLVCVALFIRNPPRIEHPTGPTSAWAGAKEIFALRALWPIFPLALVIYAPIAATRGLWISPYLSQVHHFGPDAVGLSATAMGFAFAAGGLLYAPLNRLMGEAKWTVTTGTAAIVLGWLALGLLADYSAALTLVLIVFVACLGANVAIILTHARTFLPGHLLGLGVTIMNLCFFVGAGIGQWLSGRYVKAAELAAVAPAELYGRLFIGFGLVLLVALGCYAFAPREKRLAHAKMRP